jgi:lysophospholipase L1-like esterase
MLRRNIGRDGCVLTCVRRIRHALLAAALALLAGVGSASALGGTGTHRRASGPEYYLALGDSVPVWNGTNSYPYLLLRHYRPELPGLRLVDIAESGATSGSMLQAGQYQAALSFLRAHRGHVALITIDIGGNDLVGCVSFTGIDRACGARARAALARNLGTMLSGLRRAAPRARLIGMTYYDPYLTLWPSGGRYRTVAVASVAGLVRLNRELSRLYGGPLRTADVQGAFRATDLKTLVPSRWGRVPIAVKRACSWLDVVCRAGLPGFGDDPDDAGAVVIAGAFERTVGPTLSRPRAPR